MHYEYFKQESNRLYFRGREEPLTDEDGKLRTFSRPTSILGKNRLRDLDFDIPSSKVTAQLAIILNKAEEEVPSTSDVANADDTELQEIMENAARKH